MSAPRPYDTQPFHLPAPFTSQINVNFYIYIKLFHLFFPYGIYIGTWYGRHSSFSFTHVLFLIVRARAYSSTEYTTFVLAHFQLWELSAVS